MDKENFDPTEWRWMQDGVARPVDRLTVAELQQALCYCIDTLEQLETMNADIRNIHNTWRNVR